MTKFLSSVLTVRQRLWRRCLRWYWWFVSSGSSCFSTWCSLCNIFLKRLLSLSTMSCVRVGSLARQRPSRTPRRINVVRFHRNLCLFLRVNRITANGKRLAQFQTYADFHFMTFFPQKVIEAKRCVFFSLVVLQISRQPSRYCGSVNAGAYETTRLTYGADLKTVPSLFPRW